MTITIRVAGTATGTTDAVTAVNPAVGAGATTGDVSVLCVALKPFSATVTTPTGWVKVGEGTNGSTASAADAGSTKVIAYYQVSSPVGAIGALTQSGASTMVAAINTFTSTAGGIDVTSFTVGGDTTDGANYSATGAAGIDVVTGDRVQSITSINSDAGTLTAAVIAGMAGATVADHLARTNAACTTGDDCRLYIRDVAISAGSSNAAPTMSFSNASSTSGTTLFLRLREVAGAVPLMFGQAIQRSANW